jgi:hypothetical protein
METNYLRLNDNINQYVSEKQDINNNETISSMQKRFILTFEILSKNKYTETLNCVSDQAGISSTQKEYGLNVQIIHPEEWNVDFDYMRKHSCAYIQICKILKELMAISEIADITEFKFDKSSDLFELHLYNFENSASPQKQSTKVDYPEERALSIAYLISCFGNFPEEIRQQIKEKIVEKGLCEAA